MSEKRALYIDFIKRANINDLSNSEVTIEDLRKEKEKLEQINRELFTILVAIVEQSGGTITISNESFVTSNKIDVLTFKRGITADGLIKDDLTITLHKIKKEEQQKKDE